MTKVNRDRCDQSEESLSKSIFFGLDKNAARENVRKKCAKKLKNAEFLNKNYKNQVTSVSFLSFAFNNQICAQTKTNLAGTCGPCPLLLETLVTGVTRVTRVNCDTNDYSA